MNLIESFFYKRVSKAADTLVEAAAVMVETDPLSQEYKVAFKKAKEATDEIWHATRIVKFLNAASPLLLALAGLGIGAGICYLL